MRQPPVSAPSMATLVLITILGIVSVNMFLPSLTNMARAYGVSYAQASLSISLFMMITAVLQVVIGPLSDLFGRRPVLLWSLALFSLASLGTALAPDFASFMIFRVLQSSVIAGNVLSRAIVRDTSAASEATSRLGTIGMAIALGPMLAPLIGGTLDQLWGWRATLWVFFGSGAGLLWLCWIDVGETNRNLGRGFGAHFSAYPALLTNLGFWSYTFSIGLGLGIFFAYLAAVPIISDAVFGLPESAIGALIGLPPIGFICGSYLSRRYGARIATARMVLLGRLISVLGLAAALLLWAFGPGTALSLFVLMPVIGLSNGLSTPAGMAGAMSVREDLAGSAAGLSGAVAVGISAAMTSLSGWLLSSAPEPMRMLWLLWALAIISVAVALPALRAKAPSELAAG